MAHTESAEPGRLKQHDSASDLKPLELSGSNADDSGNRPRRGHFHDSREPITPVR